MIRVLAAIQVAVVLVGVWLLQSWAIQDARLSQQISDFQQGFDLQAQSIIMELQLIRVAYAKGTSAAATGGFGLSQQ